jgi:hypothetical protein
MQVHQGIAVETYRTDVLQQQFDGSLVVENHLCFDGRLALHRLPVLDQLPGVEAGIGVALQMTRCQSISSRFRMALL